MTLNGKELAAVLKAGHAMVQADGKVEESELKVLFGELANFGVPAEQAQLMMVAADAMEASEMFETLTNLSTEAKKYVAGYLAAIMISDNDIDDSEVNMWKLICTLSKFPTMNLNEALTFWRNN